MSENHKDVLVQAAHRDDEIIWINLCNVYRFEKKDRTPLREYIRRTYTAARS